LQNDYYARKINEITSFKEDVYEIFLYFNFYISHYIMHVKSMRSQVLKRTFMKFCYTSTFIYYYVIYC